MAYLSRILINPLRQSARGYFANPQVVHAAVLGGLAQQPVEERVLWRLGERRLDGGDRVQGELLVLTRSRPSFAHIVDEAGYPGADGAAAAIRDYQPLLNLVAMGREFAFRVCVNPVYSIFPTVSARADDGVNADGARPRGKRVAHRTVAQQTAWFLDRAESRWGFRVPPTAAPATTPVSIEADGIDAAESVALPRDMRLVERRRWDFRKGQDKARNHVRLQTATFEGRLQVTDLDLFKKSLLDGIGPAKGYGCGLLTLASLNNAEA